MDSTLSSAKRASQKKYGLAVCLAAVFGIIGVHHFYLGRWMHGLFDLCLSIAGFAFLFSGQPLLGYSLLGIDYIHTIAVTIMLLIGAYKDGDGAYVCYPGQKLSSQ